MHTIIVTLFGLLSGTYAKYDQYILAPSSRDLIPRSVSHINGTIDTAASLCGTSAGSAVFHDQSSVAFDYEKNVGGIVSVDIGSTSGGDQYIGVAFSESSLWISDKWSDATADAGNDEILWWKVSPSGSYTVEPKHQRGGFRYLTLIHNGTGTVEVKRVSTHFTAMPHFADDQLRNYTGWFSSDGK
jgi:hypothetical protein